MSKQFKNQRQVAVLPGANQTKKIVITHTEVGGKPRFDMRENVVNEQEQLIPTRKGINLNPAQAAAIAPALKDFIEQNVEKPNNPEESFNEPGGDYGPPDDYNDAPDPYWPD